MDQREAFKAHLQDQAQRMMAHFQAEFRDQVIEALLLQLDTLFKAAMDKISEQAQKMMDHLSEQAAQAPTNFASAQQNVPAQAPQQSTSGQNKDDTLKIESSSEEEGFYKREEKYHRISSEDLRFRECHPSKISPYEERATLHDGEATRYESILESGSAPAYPSPSASPNMPPKLTYTSKKAKKRGKKVKKARQAKRNSPQPVASRKAEALLSALSGQFEPVARISPQTLGEVVAAHPLPSKPIVTISIPFKSYEIESSESSSSLSSLPSESEGSEAEALRPVLRQRSVSRGRKMTRLQAKMFKSQEEFETTSERRLRRRARQKASKSKTSPNQAATARAPVESVASVGNVATVEAVAQVGPITTVESAVVIEPAVKPAVEPAAEPIVSAAPVVTAKPVVPVGPVTPVKQIIATKVSPPSSVKSVSKNEDEKVTRSESSTSTTEVIPAPTEDRPIIAEASAIVEARTTVTKKSSTPCESSTPPVKIQSGVIDEPLPIIRPPTPIPNAVAECKEEKRKEPVITQEGQLPVRESSDRGCDPVSDDELDSLVRSTSSLSIEDEKRKAVIFKKDDKRKFVPGLDDPDSNHDAAFDSDSDSDSDDSDDDCKRAWRKPAKRVVRSSPSARNKTARKAASASRDGSFSVAVAAEAAVANVAESTVVAVAEVPVPATVADPITATIERAETAASESAPTTVAGPPVVCSEEPSVTKNTDGLPKSGSERDEASSSEEHAPPATDALKVEVRAEAVSDEAIEPKGTSTSDQSIEKNEAAAKVKDDEPAEPVVSPLRASSPSPPISEELMPTGESTEVVQTAEVVELAGPSEPVEVIKPAQTEKSPEPVNSTEAAKAAAEAEEVIEGSSEGTDATKNGNMASEDVDSLFEDSVHGASDHDDDGHDLHFMDMLINGNSNKRTAVNGNVGDDAGADGVDSVSSSSGEWEDIPFETDESAVAPSPPPLESSDAALQLDAAPTEPEYVKVDIVQPTPTSLSLSSPSDHIQSPAESLQLPVESQVESVQLDESFEEIQLDVEAPVASYQQHLSFPAVVDAPSSEVAAVLSIEPAQRDTEMVEVAEPVAVSNPIYQPEPENDAEQGDADMNEAGPAEVEVGQSVVPVQNPTPFGPAVPIIRIDAPVFPPQQASEPVDEEMREAEGNSLLLRPPVKSGRIVVPPVSPPFVPDFLCPTIQAQRHQAEAELRKAKQEEADKAKYEQEIAKRKEIIAKRKANNEAIADWKAKAAEAKAKSKRERREREAIEVRQREDAEAAAFQTRDEAWKLPEGNPEPVMSPFDNPRGDQQAFSGPFASAKTLAAIEKARSKAEPSALDGLMGSMQAAPVGRIHPNPNPNPHLGRAAPRSHFRPPPSEPPPERAEILPQTRSVLAQYEDDIMLCKYRLAEETKRNTPHGIQYATKNLKEAEMRLEKEKIFQEAQTARKAAEKKRAQEVIEKAALEKAAREKAALEKAAEQAKEKFAHFRKVEKDDREAKRLLDVPPPTPPSAPRKYIQPRINPQNGEQSEDKKSAWLAPTGLQSCFAEINAENTKQPNDYARRRMREEIRKAKGKGKATQKDEVAVVERVGDLPDGTAFWDRRDGSPIPSQLNLWRSKTFLLQTDSMKRQFKQRATTHERPTAARRHLVLNPMENRLPWAPSASSMAGPFRLLTPVPRTLQWMRLEEKGVKDVEKGPKTS